MSYIGTTINESPVIIGEMGAAVQGGAFCAVKFDAAGKFVLAGDGEAAVGLLMAETEERVNVGDEVTVQIKDVGSWIAGDDVSAGDMLACDADGKAVKATSGKFIVAVALEAGGAGQAIQVQICKAGFAA